MNIAKEKNIVANIKYSNGFRDEYDKLSEYEMSEIRTLTERAKRIKEQLNNEEVKSLPSVEAGLLEKLDVAKTMAKYINETNLCVDPVMLPEKNIEKYRPSEFAKKNIYLISNEYKSKITSISDFKQLYNKCVRDEKHEPIILMDEEGNVSLLVALNELEMDMERYINNVHSTLDSKMAFAFNGKEYLLVEREIIFQHNKFKEGICQYLKDLDNLYNYCIFILEKIIADD